MVQKYKKNSMQHQILNKNLRFELFPENIWKFQKFFLPLQPRRSNKPISQVADGYVLAVYALPKRRNI